MYYLCSETKGADQLRGYRETDLRLCFRICKKPVFPQSSSICVLLDLLRCNLEFSSFEETVRVQHNRLFMEPITILSQIIDCIRSFVFKSNKDSINQGKQNILLTTIQTNKLYIGGAEVTIPMCEQRPVHYWVVKYYQLYLGFDFNR